MSIVYDIDVFAAPDVCGWRTYQATDAKINESCSNGSNDSSGLGKARKSRSFWSNGDGFGRVVDFGGERKEHDLGSGDGWCHDHRTSAVNFGRDRLVIRRRQYGHYRDDDAVGQLLTGLITQLQQSMRQKALLLSSTAAGTAGTQYE